MQPFSQLDMNCNLDLAAALGGGVRYDTPGLIQMTLCGVADDYPPHALDAPFLTNHDMIRVATQMRRPERVRLAASLLFTFPGVAFIYYGEERVIVAADFSADRLENISVLAAGQSGGVEALLGEVDVALGGDGTLTIESMSGRELVALRLAPAKAAH